MHDATSAATGESATRPRRVRRALSVLVPALLVLAPLAASTVGSAAQLDVSAAPLQTWLVDDLPEPELPTEPPMTSVPVECGEPSAYDAVVPGTAGADLLEGDPSKAEVFLGLDGDDQISGDNSDDCLVGGPGDDTLDGGPGDDILIGGDGNDTLQGGPGRDNLDGGPGNDTLDGGPGSDSIRHGGDAGDECTDTRGPDTVEPDCGAPAVVSPRGDSTATTPRPQAPQGGAERGAPAEAAGAGSAPASPPGRNDVIAPSEAPADGNTA